MPVVYDNWERLVQAVQRREQYWEMAHAHSRSTSAASSVSLDFDELSLSLPREDTNIENEGTSSRSDYSPSQLLNDPVKSIENDLSSKGLSGNGSKSRNSFISSDASQNAVEWIEKYEDGVYITVVAFHDGSRDIKQARFSKRRFTENQAETWWSENREKVYKNYNIRGIYGFSASNKAAMRTEGIALQGINGSKSRNSIGSGKGDANQTEDAWNEQYEDGVYITVVAFHDGSRDIKQARFSKRRFTENQAETWWSENREKIYKNYNIRGIYGFSASNKAAMRTEGIALQGINGSKSRNSVGSGEGDANQTEDAWNEQYEDGVYITVVAFQDGSRDIKRARFSKRRFTENQAETWWSENREKVYKKYNIREIYNAASRTEGVVPQGINNSSRNSVGSVKGDAISSR